MSIENIVEMQYNVKVLQDKLSMYDRQLKALREKIIAAKNDDELNALQAELATLKREIDEAIIAKNRLAKQIRSFYAPYPGRYIA